MQSWSETSPGPPPALPDDLPLFLSEKLARISMIAPDDYDADDFASFDEAGD